MWPDTNQPSQNEARHDSSRFDVLGGHEKGGFVGYVLAGGNPGDVAQRYSVRYP